MVEGGKQGGVAASHLAALAPQPVLLAADSILEVNGGCVLAIRVADGPMPVIADDAYMLRVGSPEDIAAVYPDYKANLKDRRLDQRGQKELPRCLAPPSRCRASYLQTVTSQ
jgi:hypothetical protein